MAIEITSLRQLDATKVAAMTAKLAQYMQERHPNVTLTRGVFHDLVLYMSAELNAAIQENIDRVRQSQSLYAISLDPTLADNEIVDQVLSNYNLTRDAGIPAVGVLTLVFNLPLQTRIPQASVFAANNVNFVPTEPYTILPPGSAIVNTGDRVMVPVGDGTYAANIVVQAETVGAAGNIKRGATVTANVVVNNTLSAFAASDFISGRDALSNADYVAKLPEALAAKTIGGRASYVALLKAQSAFQNVRHVSIMGCGDPEQQRDQHGLFPVSAGGKVDLYVQTSDSAQLRDHLLEATFLSTSANGTIWQVALDKDTAAGFYEVRRIAKPNDTTSTGYSVTQDVRGVNTTNAVFVPDMLYLAEAAYSRFQTAVIRFEDTETPTAGLVPGTSKARYTVTTIGLPLIAEINDYLTSRDVRARGADILVKAAVPCFTGISFQLATEANELISDSTLASIKQAVVDAVAAVGFSGQLHASTIESAVHKYLTGRQAVSQLDMFGRIRRPDGTTAYIRSSDLLLLPDDPGRMVTGRTTVFLTGVDDVAISTQVAGFLN